VILQEKELKYNIAVIINARIKSTRVPNKLIRPFHDTTLIEIALRKLSKITNVQEKYLAAFDEEIINIYNQQELNDVKLLLRTPDSVARGNISHNIAFKHFNEVNSDYIMIFNPCHVFTDVQLYMNAIEYFFSNNLISLTSVLENKNIYFNESFSAINLSLDKQISTQNQKNIYSMAHVFHIFNKNKFIQDGVLWDFKENDPCFMLVDKKSALDIDDELDFLISELLYKHEKTNFISSYVE
jgi:CMP-N-acetylneuraminic acid synthetase